MEEFKKSHCLFPVIRLVSFVLVTLACNNSCMAKYLHLSHFQCPLSGLQELYEEIQSGNPEM